MGWGAVAGCCGDRIVWIALSRNWARLLLLHLLLASICSSTSRETEIARDAPRPCTVDALQSSIVALDYRGRFLIRSYPTGLCKKRL